MKPTDEQIKEFWERHGFAWRKSVEIKRILDGRGFTPVLSQDGWYYEDKYFGCHELPPLTLDNLFKYAVPKVEQVHLQTRRAYTGPIAVGDGYIATVWEGALGVSGEDEDPSLALFWAIWEVIK